MSTQKLELTWLNKDRIESIEPRILIEDTKLNYSKYSDDLFSNSYNDNILIHGDNLLALKSLIAEKKLEQAKEVWENEKNKQQAEFESDEYIKDYLTNLYKCKKEDITCIKSEITKVSGIEEIPTIKKSKKDGNILLEEPSEIKQKVLKKLF